MPIIKSAKKALRSSARKRVFNVRRQAEMRDVLKKLEKEAVAGKKQEAEALLGATYQAIDKAAKRGIIKENTASRKKARAARMVAAIAK